MLLLNQLSFQAFIDFYRLRINRKIQQNFDKNIKKKDWNLGWLTSGPIEGTLIVVPKIILSLDFKTNFKQNLICRKKTKFRPLYGVWPCRNKQSYDCIVYTRDKTFWNAFQLASFLFFRLFLVWTGLFTEGQRVMTLFTILNL